MIILDGSDGEGGGQILRSALTLSMLTGQPFRIEKIRAGRKKPGLMRQHLTCIEASAEICGAKTNGAELLSQKVSFDPGGVKPGAYTFAIGTAGATCLVFQTVFLPLMRAGASTVRLIGGTHNAFAPSYDDIERSYLPLVRRMGGHVTTRLERHGFYPAGGGIWQADIGHAPTLQPLTIDEAGPAVSRRVRSRAANIPYDIAEREAATAAGLLSWPNDTIEAHGVKADGPGNVLMIEIASEHVTETFTAFGERGLTAEAVAAQAVEQARNYMAVGAPVGPHLADQLLLPMALAGGGQFTTGPLTPHTKTNIAVIEKFLPVEFDVTELGAKRWRVAVSE